MDRPGTQGAETINHESQEECYRDESWVFTLARAYDISKAE